MKLLVLGGTRFLGRHLVAQALEAGHRVTLLHRGRSASGLFPEAEHRIADRDGDLAALADGAWDAAIDTSAYVPRQVHRVAAALGDRVGHYLLVSTISVYAGTDRASTGEDAPLVALADPATEVVDGATYGGLKALCEAAALQDFAGRCLVARPGLIVGPHDPTGRFSWWVQRIGRGGAVLAPGDPAAPVQCIDARDAAAWLLRQAERGTRGVFNLSGPTEPATMAAVLDAIAQGLHSDARFHWVDAAFLLAQGVAPWTDLPLWLPQAQSGMHRMALDRALATGLQTRQLAQTAADTAAWLATAPPPLDDGLVRPPVGLGPDRETALLAAWRARPKT